MDVLGFPIAIFEYRRVHDQTLEFQMLFPRSPWVAMGPVFFHQDSHRPPVVPLVRKEVVLPAATRFRVGSGFRFKTAFHEFPT